LLISESELTKTIVLAVLVTAAGAVCAIAASELNITEAVMIRDFIIY
jgi:hypothetical protein